MIEARLAQVDQDYKEIQKMLSIKALVNVEDSTVSEKNIDEIIEEEFLRREELLRDNLRKNLNIFKDAVLQEFNLTSE